MTDLIYKEEVYQIVGAGMEVYNQLGPGFLEAVYQEAVEIEFDCRNIPYRSQPEIPIRYKDRILKKFYVADFLVFDKVVVEIKALDRLIGDHDAQLLNQLKGTGLAVGVLLNFGYPGKLEWKRMVYTKTIPVSQA
jgi:GxxExxY protein